MLTKIIDLFERLVVAQERQADAAEMLARNDAPPMQRPGTAHVATIPGGLTATASEAAAQDAPTDYGLLSLDALKALCEERQIMDVLGPDGKVVPRTRSATLIKALETFDAMGQASPPASDEQPAQEPDPLAEETAPAEVTQEDVLNVLKALRSRTDNATVSALLGKFGSKNISGLAKDDYAAVIKAAEEM